MDLVHTACTSVPFWPDRNVTALDLRSLFDFCLFTTSWVVGLKDSEAGLFSPDMVADMYVKMRD